MNKKITYLLGTTTMIIALISSSATAFACGGDMGEISPVKDYKKSIVTVNSKPSNKSATTIWVDGVEKPVLPKGNKTEKQRVINALKEIGCSMAKMSKDPESMMGLEAEAYIKSVFKKYGFKTDDKSLEALEAKYNNINTEIIVKKAFQQCGGIEEPLQ